MNRADCPVYQPSPVDMLGSLQDFIIGIEKHSEHFGICKIVPPPSWKPCSDGYVNQDGQMPISSIKQVFAPNRETAVSGFYSGTFTPLRKQKVQAFQKEADSASKASAHDNLEVVEKAYWKAVTRPTVYGADNEGSLFDKGIKEWNPATLDSCLSRGLATAPTDESVKGVNTPYLYYGRWRSTFAWHTEDMELHSLNYLHYGAPKVWYCVSPAHKEKMDSLVAKTLYAQHDQCKDYMRHKTVMIKPEVLEANGIPVQRVVQHPGDFIINFPGAYHAGFNVGFNCAESTNFATPSWIKHGATADFCRCSPEQQSVRLDMGLFLAQAPDEHARGLVKQWILRAQAARRKPVGKLLHEVNEKHAALDSQSGRSSMQQEIEGSRPVCKARAKATVQGIGAAQLVNHSASGALRKPAMCAKLVKKVSSHSKAKLGSAGKAGSKVAAAMLKMAKRAKLAPSATAKVPQLQPISSSAKSSVRPLHATKSPAKARGRPKSSTKACVAATDAVMTASVAAMQGLDHSLDASTQVNLLPTQQHDMAGEVGQTFQSAGLMDAQLLGKRKRNAPTTATLEEAMTSEEALKATHHQVAVIDGQYMSGGRPTKKAKQAATFWLPHIKPVEQVQQAAAQQEHISRLTQHEQPTSQVVLMQQTDLTQQAGAQAPEPTNSASFQLQSNPLRSNKRQRVHQATTETAFTGSQGPTSLILPLKWLTRRNRSRREARRADAARACTFP